jgi:hydrogenase maturation protease
MSAHTGADHLSRVVGVGCRDMGDDGVGPAVLDALREHAVDAADLVEVRDPTRLVELIQGVDRVVIVDAVTGAPAPPGSVLQLTEAHYEDRALRSTSSHGVGVVDALRLAAATVPADRLAHVRVVAVAVDPSGVRPGSLTEAVAAAVPRAAAAVHALLADHEDPAHA